MADINQSIGELGGVSSLYRINSEIVDMQNQAFLEKAELEKRLVHQLSNEEAKAFTELQKKKNKALQDSLKKQRDMEIEITKAAVKLETDSKNKNLLKAELHEKKMAKLREQSAEKVMEMSKKATAAIGQAVATGLNRVDSAMDSYTKYVTAISTRIQGSGLSFKGLSETVRRNIGFSPYVSQQKVMDNMANLIESGIMYNVEQRAFLQSVSENIARTFDAANGTLVQLIRIQQADTTAARLGMEASITKFLNANYSDSSYMNNEYKTVMSNLMGVSAFMSSRDAVEFEYNVQKWLGSLGSLGVSGGTLSTIAQGLNYLGTGNVSALQSNTSLMNLLTIAAQRSGENIATILTSGLTARSASNILGGIASFGKQIGRAGNKVAMQKYAELFGFDISDIAALQNLTAADFENIAKSNLTYGGALGELDTQLSTMPQRMHISKMINNLLENTIWTTATGIADNAFPYITWKVAGLLDEVFGDALKIPTVGALGNFVDIKATVPQLVKAGLMGTSLGMGLVSQIGSGLFGSQGLTLGNWNAAETLARGKGRTTITSGVSTGLSQSGFIGQADSSDISQNITQQARQQAKEESGVEEEDNHIEKIDNTVASILRLLESGFLQVKVEGLSALGT